MNHGSPTGRGNRILSRRRIGLILSITGTAIWLIYVILLPRGGPSYPPAGLSTRPLAAQHLKAESYNPIADEKPICYDAARLSTRGAGR